MRKLSRLSVLAGVAAVSVMGLVPVSAVHAQGGPAEQVDALEALAGKQAGMRRSGAKGICASGYFTGNTVGRALSSSSVFSGEKVPVVARFSVGGGNPKASDKGKTARGLALQFMLPKGEQWMMANISAPVFFVARVEDFIPFVMARVNDPATGKPDPVKLKAYNDAHPESLRQGAFLSKAAVPASYATAQYWGVNAFELVNAKGQSQFVRWQFVPSNGVMGLTDEQLKTMPDNFLFDELRKRVSEGAVSFDFKLQLAEAGDTLVDPTQQWPETRTVVPAGTLVIDKVEAGAGGACDKITFNPLVLPKGIKASADPILAARPASYGVSLGRRLGEAAAAK